MFLHFFEIYVEQQDSTPSFKPLWLESLNNIAINIIGWKAYTTLLLILLAGKLFEIITQNKLLLCKHNCIFIQIITWCKKKLCY